MDQICLVTPILPGRADYARDFFAELDGRRMPEYARSEARVGIDKEVWFLASGPHDVVLVVYIEAADFAYALERLSSSQDEFDLWFKRGLFQATGIDLNDPALALPELLSHYSASIADVTRQSSVNPDLGGASERSLRCALHGATTKVRGGYHDANMQLPGQDRDRESRSR